MGIQGLLPLLRECQRAAHIQEYKGQTLGIDAYVWLHRGAYGCAEELATGKPTVKYVKYALHRIRLLRHYGITPYVVFDGGLLPSKQGTEKDREGRREEAIAKARALALEGKHAQAREYYVKAVDVTPQMAYQLIKTLKAEDVSYVVAPYEADAQLAYLEKKGHIDGIITEDSDLLVFGCRKVLFKLDSDGRCMEIKRENFTMCREVSFSGWTDKEFRQMAILSGCDYLASIPGLGLKTAHGLMRRYKSAGKVIRFIRLEGQLKVPRNYEQEFERAELTFVHQRVFCPEAQKLVYLEDLEEHVLTNVASPQAEELKFIGPFLDQDVAYGIARGDICPLSKAKMIDIAPDADVLAANPRPPAIETKGSLKDYFKPSPAGDKSSGKSNNKRNALGELKPNNLFSVTTESTAANKTSNKAKVRTVKSRFFVPATKHAPVFPDVVAIEDSDEEKTPDVTRRSEICCPDLQPVEGRTISAIDLHGAVKQDLHALQPRAVANLEELGRAESFTGFCSNFEREQDVPTINRGQTAKVAGHISLPPMPAPQPAQLPEEEVFEDITGCISSPNPSPEPCSRPRKLRRYHSEGPTSEETLIAPKLSHGEDEDAADVGSPEAGANWDSAPPIVTMEGPGPSTDRYFVDLTDISSPTSIRCEKVHTAGGDDPVRQGVTVTSETCPNTLWSDEVIVSDHEEITEVSIKRTKSLVRAPTSKQSGKRLPRCKAIMESPEDLRGPIDVEDEETKQKMVEFDKRVSSVVAGWRNKFAPSSAKSSRKSSKSRSSSSPFATRKTVSRAPLSPLRPAKQAVPPQCSSPITSSTPPSDRKSVRRSEKSISPVDCSPKAKGKGLSSLSQSTFKALDAFRYRSSATPSSSFSS